MMQKILDAEQIQFSIIWLNLNEEVTKTLFEPFHDKTNKMTCATSKDSDQLGHPPSLISLHCPLDESLNP